jgi:Ca-activated chloride channel family protein
MAWRILPSLSLILAPMLGMAADSPDKYFHAGVQDYIFGEKDKAVTEIGTGLQIYPEDPKLNGAWKLLQKKDQENKQQQNKDQKNQQDQKDKKDQKDQKDQQQNQQQQQKQQQQKSEQQKKDEEKAKQEQAKKDQEKREQEAQAEKGEQKDKKDEQAQQADATELHMSPQEARKLLESLKDESKVLLFSPTNQPAKTQPGKFKDW